MLAANNHHALSTLMAELQEEAVMELVRQCLVDGVDPLVIIDLCHKGMIQLGEYYEQGRYFISGLIMAGEIMGQVGRLVFSLLESKITHGDAGSIVLGTVEGDIHFIGKDIFKVLVRAHGFAVHDLGVDVPSLQFLAAIHEFKPALVGLSGLITGAFKPMQETIALLKENTPQELAPRAYIIGGQVNASVCKEVGADYWADDGMKGVRLCQEIMGGGAARVVR
jgi:methanogenic corrinoid protein MtbC1